ncbi:MAG: DUF4368 domain-containing protein, partial [Treponema sp.]|nr:DUF4368 domain-containing protein [Treponema sp.]
YTMRSSKNRGKYYLQCYNRHIAKDACIGAFISVDKLERIVSDELNRLSSEYLNQDELERGIEFSNSIRSQKQRLLSDFAIWRKKIDECTKAIRDLYLDKVKGILSESDFISLTKEFSSEKSRLEQHVKEGQERLEELEARIMAGDNRRELIERYTNLNHLTREMVEVLIDYIVIGKRQPGEKSPPVEIHWNF